MARLYADLGQVVRRDRRADGRRQVVQRLGHDANGSSRSSRSRSRRTSVRRPVKSSLRKRTCRPVGFRNSVRGSTGGLGWRVDTFALP
jgi:hypothetical protein